jgi:hypothetical protein
MAVKPGAVIVRGKPGGSVWVTAGIGDGGTTVGKGRGEAVAEAHAVSRINPTHTIGIIFMSISTGSLY